MQKLQDLKIVYITPPAAIVDNSAYTTASIDTKGWDEALVCVLFGAMDIAMAALKLRESDDDSTYADITGADFSTSPATLPSATSDNTFFGIHVKCGGGRKRYIDLTATGGDGAAGTYMSAFVILAKGEASPASVTDRGFSQLLYV